MHYEKAWVYIDAVENLKISLYAKQNKGFAGDISTIILLKDFLTTNKPMIWQK